MAIASSTSECAPVNVKEDCCPGAPFITFCGPAPSLSLTVLNPQPLSGHITQWLPVHTGDSVHKVAAALARADTSIQGNPSGLYTKCLHKENNMYTTLHFMSFKHTEWFLDQVHYINCKDCGQMTKNSMHILCWSINSLFCSVEFRIHHILHFFNNILPLLDS